MQKRTGSVPLIFFRCFFPLFQAHLLDQRDQQKEEPKQARLCLLHVARDHRRWFPFYPVEMGVRLHGDLHRITQTLGHGHDGITQLHQESSMGVPEVMNPDALHPGSGSNPVKLPVQRSMREVEDTIPNTDIIQSIDIGRELVIKETGNGDITDAVLGLWRTRSVLPFPSVVRFFNPDRF